MQPARKSKRKAGTNRKQLCDVLYMVTLKMTVRLESGVLSYERRSGDLLFLKLLPHPLSRVLFAKSLYDSSHHTPWHKEINLGGMEMGGRWASKGALPWEARPWRESQVQTDLITNLETERDSEPGDLNDIVRPVVIDLGHIRVIAMLNRQIRRLAVS